MSQYTRVEQPMPCVHLKRFWKIQIAIHSTKQPNLSSYQWKPIHSLWPTLTSFLSRVLRAGCVSRLGSGLDLGRNIPTSTVNPEVRHFAIARRIQLSTRRKLTVGGTLGLKPILSLPPQDRSLFALILIHKSNWKFGCQSPYRGGSKTLLLSLSAWN